MIQFQRVAPWWHPTTYVDPRIRSFAGEIRTLRNMHAHGNDCVDEHVRLVDTAIRLLQMLDLPIPGGLQPPDRAPTTDPSVGEAIAVLEQPSRALDLYDSELENLGVSGERVGQLLRRAQELPEVLYRQALETYESDPGSPAADYVQSQLDKTIGNAGRKITGAEVLDLLDETFRLETDGNAQESAVLKVLALFARCTLLDGALGLVALNYAMDEAIERFSSESALKVDNGKSPARLSALADQTTMLAELAGQSDAERWLELVRLAHDLNEGSPIANLAIVQGNFKLLEDPAIESEEALRLSRESSASARMLAAMDPGSVYETFVIHSLRNEGKLCNDLGLPDDATRAFARADEIIDRYPTADPPLMH